ncbi:MAG: hypothetical protein KF859_05670 [Phycisphaeraceae bacterium]|nr:hypothetical protein [Phycisphaeraceae bacterium]
MSQTRMLVMSAGAALSIAASAFAQNVQDKAYQAELLSDAASRTSRLAQGGSGYDAQGFMIGSADGNNTLYIFGSAQITYTMNFRNEDDDPAEGVPDGEGFTHGFENKIARIGVRGSIWDKAFTYQVRGEFGNSGDFGLETAFGQYTWDNGFAVRFGQFKHALLRESMIDNEYQLAAERSIAEGVFGGGYVQGIMLMYTAESFRIFGGFTDGLNTANSPFNSGAEADWAFNARGEFKVMGSGWERFDDFTSWRSAEDNGLIIGAAVHYQQSGDTGGTGGVDGNGDPIEGLDILRYTIDAQFEGKGFNVFAAFLGDHTDTNQEGADSLDTFGAVIQAGVFVTDQVELFGRWDAIFPDGDADDQHFGTLGVNYYLSPESHAVKLTAQVVMAFQETNSLFASANPEEEFEGGLFGGVTRYGILGGPDDPEIALILQAQIVY